MFVILTEMLVILTEIFEIVTKIFEISTEMFLIGGLQEFVEKKKPFFCFKKSNTFDFAIEKQK